MNILVTGGAGFIGSNIVEELVKTENCNVRILDDLSSGKLDNLKDFKDQIEFVKGSILDDEILKKACKGIDCIFHLAAKPSVVESIEKPLLTNDVNVVGTIKLLTHANNANVKKIIYSSSTSVYGNTDIIPVSESVPVAPLSPYALQKYSAEQYCLFSSSYYKTKAIALRYFNVFGPRQQEGGGYAGVVYKFISDADSKKVISIEGDGLQTRDFVFVKDIVSANIAAMNAQESCYGRYYNIGTGRETSILDLAKYVSEVIGNDIKIKYIAARPMDIPRSVANIEKAQNNLLYNPKYKIVEGLKQTYEWFFNSKIMQ